MSGLVPSSPIDTAGRNGAPSLVMRLAALVGLVCLALGMGTPRLWAEGTVDSCDQQGLMNALAGGGDVTFEGDCDITLTSTILLTNSVNIDADGFNVVIRSLFNAVDSTATNITATTNFVSTPIGTNCSSTPFCVTNEFGVNCTNIISCSTNYVVSTNITFTTNIVSDTAFTNGVRLFEVASNVNVSFTGVSLVNGRSLNGGALFIRPGGVVLAADCLFTGNYALGTNGLKGGNGGSTSGIGKDGGNGGTGQTALGGAIYNQGRLDLLACHFLTNNAIGAFGGDAGNGGNGDFRGGNGGKGGAGGSGYGGAVYNRGVLSIRDCTFGANTVAGGDGGIGGLAGGGGGIGLTGAGGAAGSAGGAGVYSLSNATVIACTFADNTGFGGNSADGGQASSGDGTTGAHGGDGYGGGLANLGSGAVTNCTFYNNHVVGGNAGNGGNGEIQGGNGGSGGDGAGGGLYNSGNIKVVNCTFAFGGAWGGTNGLAGGGSFPGSGGSMGTAHGGNIAGATGTFYLKNSIITTNASGGNGYGTITDAGNNISSDNSLAFGSASFKKTDPRLADLGDNGGPTLTMALLSDSPAIEAGDDLASPSDDQIGSFRPSGLHSDIGAVEVAAFTIEGEIITFDEGQNLSGITVTAGRWSTKTASDGSYILAVVPGSYDVTPVSTNFIFDPVSDPIEVIDENIIGEDFFAFEVFAISGRVLNGAAGLSGVTVSVDTGESTITDASGNYRISGLEASFYTVSATRAGFGFDPEAAFVEIGPSATGINFAAFPAYNISGRVTNGAAGVAGVLVTAGTRSANTDGNGNYSITGLRSNVYTVTPSPVCYKFTPVSRPAKVGPNHTNNVNFGATPEAFTISGRVTVGGNGLSGVTVNGGGGSAITGTNGNYTLTNVCAGTYPITASRAGYQLAPASLSVTVGPNATNRNFTATEMFSIGGRLLDGTNGVGGVHVLVGTNLVTTGADGAYAVAGLLAGAYTVSPTQACFQFVPTNRIVSVGPSTNGVDFATTHGFTISGVIADGTNNVSGVSVKVVGGGTTNIVTTTNGNFTVSTLCAGTYTVTPTLGCYQFSPASRAVDVGPNTNGVNFAATSGFVISGIIADGTNNVSGVSVMVTGGGITNIVTTTNGNFTVAGLCAGVYTVTPTLACYQISPSSRTASVGPNTNGVNFTATHGYVVSGRITEGAQGLAGVSVVVGTSTNTTDANGNYAVPAICPGVYTITPLLGCYQFFPTNQSVSVGPSVSNKDFVAFRTDVFTIRGRVTRDGTNGLSGVTVSNGNSTTNTDVNGNYVLTRVCLGTSVVTPVLAGYGFVPGSRVLTISADTNGVDFVAAPIFSITGQILDGTNGVSGVSVTATTSNSTTTVFTTNGSYTISGLSSNSYTVTPSLACYAFGPISRAVNVGPTNAVANFAATHDVHTISGRVTEGAVGLVGITIQAGGQLTNTDANGYYVLSGLCPGSYTVAPAGECYQFFPTSRSATLGPDGTGADFVAFRNTFTVRGRVVNQAANGVNGVTVSAENHTTLTDTNGNYVLPCLAAGSHTLMASLVGYKFVPVSLPLTVGSDTNGLNFSAYPVLAINWGTNRLAQLLFWAAPAMNYRIEASTNLVNWETVFVTNNVNGPLSLFQFVDADSANFSRRYYRLADNLLLLLNRTGGGAAQLSFAVVPDRNYLVRASTNLIDWQMIFTTNFTTNTLSGSTGLFQFIDSDAPNFPRRFYQLNRY